MAIATGGGLFDEGNTLALSNSTVSGNKAGGGGGGIYIQTDVYPGVNPVVDVNLTFSTISSNIAPVGADILIAAISSNGQPSNQQVSGVKIRNSIVANSLSHPGSSIGGMLTSYGYNLFQVNSGATFDPSTTAQHRTDKLLSAQDLSRLFASPVGLRNNGGHTLTYALAPGSPAIDAIPLQYCQLKVIFDSQSKKYTDQRGFPRPDGNEGACDIGAYEYVD